MSIGEGLVRVGAPLAVALLFAAVLLRSGAAPDRDLQIITASTVAPGRPMAIRALWLEGLRRPEGPSLVHGPVAVRLVDEREQAIAEARLTPSAVAGMEGVLDVPPAASGALSLRGRAAFDGGASVVHAPLQIRPEPPELKRRGRLASPLQQYRAFALKPEEGDEPAPRPFEVRIEGGACVPEHPCVLQVWVGEPAASVRLEATGAVEVVEDGTPVTDGIATVTLVVHGPEADAVLHAVRDGQVVARRTVRLPIAQGAPVLLVDSPILDAPASPSLRLLGPTPGSPVIVDAFREGQWERTGSTRVGDDGSLRLPFADLDAGVWRIQVRTDPFAAGSAAARVLVVRSPEGDGEGAVRALAHRAEALALQDPFARRVLASGILGDASAEEQVAFLAALQELDLVEQPTALSGYVQETVGAEATIDAWRVLAAVGVGLVGLLVGAYLLWRGWRAAREADQLLAEAMSDLEPRTVRPGAPAVLGLAFAIALIFALVALFIMTRGTFG
jgi:hypothetical protein